MKISYSVVEAAPEAVAKDLERLWGANLHVAGDVAHKFRWLYRDAPDRSAVVFMLAAQTAEGGRDFVGTAGVCVRRFQLGGREVTAALLADLAVDKDHRSLGPALNLVKQVKAHALGAHALAYGFPNQNAVAVFKRAGYQPLGTIVRYARVLRHEKYLDHIRNAEVPRLPKLLKRAVDRAFDIAPLARAGAAAIDVGRLLQGTPDAVRASRHHELAWLDGPDDRFDALWERARSEYAIVGRRSAAFLRWRFPADPHTRIAALIRRSERSIAAYAVVQIEASTGTAHVRDFFGHHDAFAPLLDRLLPALYRRGATSVSIRYLGAARLVELLTRRGFAQRPGERTITWASASPVQGDVGVWHLLDADEDT